MSTQDDNPRRASSSEGRPEPDSSPEEAFAAQYRGEIGAQLDTIERLIALIGAVTTLLTALAWDLPLFVGWASGWLVGQANVAVLRRMMAKVIVGGTGGKVGTAMLVVKMLLLLGLVWGMLHWLPASPAGFVGGFTATIAGLVLGSVIVAHRHWRGGSGTQPPVEAADDPNEPGGGGHAERSEGPDASAQVWSPT